MKIKKAIHPIKHENKHKSKESKSKGNVSVLIPLFLTIAGSRTERSTVHPIRRMAALLSSSVSKSITAELLSLY